MRPKQMSRGVWVKYHLFLRVRLSEELWGRSGMSSREKLRRRSASSLIQIKWWRPPREAKRRKERRMEWYRGKGNTWVLKPSQGHPDRQELPLSSLIISPYPPPSFAVLNFYIFSTWIFILLLLHHLCDLSPLHFCPSFPNAHCSMPLSSLCLLSSHFHIYCSIFSFSKVIISTKQHSVYVGSNYHTILYPGK